MLTSRATAQSFKILHTFNSLNVASASNTKTNSDGANPLAGLILSGDTLYGVAEHGGTNGAGTVFAVSAGATYFTTLHTFALAAENNQEDLTNKDGALPLGNLTLSGTTFYGTAEQGGTNGTGTIFAINTNGMSFTNLYTFAAGSNGFSTGVFTNSTGSGPQSGLLLLGNTLYGTAAEGGTNGAGTIFSITTNGTGFTILHTFALGALNAAIIFTNRDGRSPVGGLVLSGNTLYGTTEIGGTNGDGTVFALNTNGMGFTTLHTFTDNDGINPWAGLTLSSNTLYGTTINGGDFGRGTIFAINTNGGGFTNLYFFASLIKSTNSDGADPWGGLVLSNNVLYGVAAAGGNSDNGTVFAVNTNGMGFTNLHTFALGALNAASIFTNSDGVEPVGGLVLSGNTLYGTTEFGGTNGNGTVFSLSLDVTAPPLTIILSGTNAILTWPDNAGVFNLQSTTNLASPNWITISGQNAVTNPISGTQQFFRLSQ